MYEQEGQTNNLKKASALIQQILVVVVRLFSIDVAASLYNHKNNYITL